MISSLLVIIIINWTESDQEGPETQCFSWRPKNIDLSLAHRVEAGEYESKAESDEENIVVPE